MRQGVGREWGRGGGGGGGGGVEGGGQGVHVQFDSMQGYLERCAGQNAG